MEAAAPLECLKQGQDIPKAKNSNFIRFVTPKLVEFDIVCIFSSISCLVPKLSYLAMFKLGFRYLDDLCLKKIGISLDLSEFQILGVFIACLVPQLAFFFAKIAIVAIF